MLVQYTSKFKGADKMTNNYPINKSEEKLLFWLFCTTLLETLSLIITCFYHLILLRQDAKRSWGIFGLKFDLLAGYLGNISRNRNSDGYPIYDQGICAGKMYCDCVRVVSLEYLDMLWILGIIWSDKLEVAQSVIKMLSTGLTVYE